MIEGSSNKIFDYFQDSLFVTQRSNANPPNHKRILALPTQMNDIPANKEKYESCDSYRTIKWISFPCILKLSAPPLIFYNCYQNLNKRPIYELEINPFELYYVIFIYRIKYQNFPISSEFSTNMNNSFISSKVVLKSYNQNCLVMCSNK